MKAVFADFFSEEDSPAAFANIIIQSGLASAFGFFVFPNLTPVALVSLPSLPPCRPPRAERLSDFHGTRWSPELWPFQALLSFLLNSFSPSRWYPNAQCPSTTPAVVSWIFSSFNAALFFSPAQALIVLITAVVGFVGYFVADLRHQRSKGAPQLLASDFEQDVN